MLKESAKMQELQHQKRADEWAAREQKMAMAVNRMANTVVKDKDLAERQLEQRIYKYE